MKQNLITGIVDKQHIGNVLAVKLSSHMDIEKLVG